MEFKADEKQRSHKGKQGTDRLKANAFNRSVRLRPTRTKCCSRMRPGSACNSNEVPDAEAARPSRGAAQSRTTENEASSAAQQQPAVASRQTCSAAQRKWGAERQQHRQYLCTVREIELERDSRQWERLRRSNGNGDGAATAFGFIFSFSFRVESARAATSTATLTKCVFGHCCARVCQCVRVRAY